MRSPEEYEIIRESNRRALGLAGTSGVASAPLGMSGLGDGILGTVLGAAGPIRVASAFPSVEYSWNPGSPAPPVEQGSGIGEWFTKHVVRPEFEYAGVRYAPGDGVSDLSGWARVLAWIAAAAAALGIGWVAYRAFGPRQRRANRHRYFVAGRRA